MIVEKFLVRPFTSQDTSYEYAVLVPDSSQFLETKVLSDGIYAFYLIPLVVESRHKEIFFIASKDAQIPEGFEFVTILDIFVEDKEKGQGVVIYPMFRKSN